MGVQASAISLHILGYVVDLGKPIEELCHRLVDLPQPLNVNLQETCEDGATVVKAAQHKCMDEGDASFEIEEASKEAELPQ